MSAPHDERQTALTQSALPAGTKAPDFTLPSTPDQKLSLSDFRGSPVILAFYPAGLESGMWGSDGVVQRSATGV